ncbi:hypothetical protein [Glutamicibacter creatinolyticus]|uniref:hypothetical protein n=1 Tax=Glutamicibacter creatinolyticus TaxID=162496 RepID=UPI0032174935
MPKLTNLPGNPHADYFTHNVHSAAALRHAGESTTGYYQMMEAQANASLAVAHELRTISLILWSCLGAEPTDTVSEVISARTGYEGLEEDD